MKLSIDNSQRKFLVQSQGFGSQRDIFCNLNQIPFVLAEVFEVNEEYKVFEYWNRKLKQVSKKRLAELYKANQINPKNIVQTVDVVAYEWFDKVNGNSYFAATVTVNYGLKSEKVIKVPYQYGYSDAYRYEAIKQLIEQGLIIVADKEQPSHYIYSKLGITTTHRKIENCKKSELKNI